MKGLFQFPSAITRDPAVDAWLDSQPAALGEIARAWFSEMRRAGSDVRELMHDGCPVACVEDFAFGYVNVFTSHVNVGFFHGADLDDPADLLKGSGKRMRHVTLRPEVDTDQSALVHLIEDAYADMKRKMNPAAGRTHGG